ncbi:MAG: UvrD-helicase domain-containing protein [Anaerolineales bacterium]|nr:UvrD-helicase domain-containing protein [Chloroflexota bacterium]MBL6981885.1 UvrD-helicase domain-containing protein [Anaerolineales bacterium]
MSLEITNDDIDKAEAFLLPQGAKFCEERRSFIRSLDTLDVQACPGSGKTTALLAKLLIMSSKIPLPNNTGICVLTHTNAAIDEIKRRISKRSSGIFQYPNYVGTIQTFVNKFLAIPAFIDKYGKRPIAIDNEQFYYEVIRSEDQEIRKAVRWLRQRKYTDVRNLRFSFDQFIISKSLNDERPFLGQDSPTYKNIEKHKLHVLEKGYLCFDDAYTLANEYLLKYPQIGILLSLRFKYVFVDEMQDTDIHQNRILDAIFHSDLTIVQRIGDQNQAIYTYDVKEDLVWKPENVVYINGSKRLSQPVANAIKNIALSPQELDGNPDKPEIKPILILFDDADIAQVIPKFCELVVKHDLHDISENPIKVVGWAGKEHESKHRIGNYWPAYINERKQKGKTVRDSLEDFINLGACKDINARAYSLAIVDGILRFLQINSVTRVNGRYFTASSFFSYLDEEIPDLLDELKLNLARWVLLLSQGDDVFEQIKDFLFNRLAKDNKFGFRVSDSIAQIFFERGSQANSSHNDETSQIVLPGSVPFVVDTIHGVKGETHTATLYLETFNNGYDVSNVIHCFYPDSSHGNLNVTQKRSLKMAYVAMSRPTHLLCVAIHKNTIGARNKKIIHNPDEIREIFGDYWDVIEI